MLDKVLNDNGTKWDDIGRCVSANDSEGGKNRNHCRLIIDELAIDLRE